MLPLLQLQLESIKKVEVVSITSLDSNALAELLAFFLHEIMRMESFAEFFVHRLTVVPVQHVKPFFSDVNEELLGQEILELIKLRVSKPSFIIVTSNLQIADSGSEVCV
jgi:hypothetical protein